MHDTEIYIIRSNSHAHVKGLQQGFTMTLPISKQYSHFNAQNAKQTIKKQRDCNWTYQMVLVLWSQQRIIWMQSKKNL